MPDSSTTLHEPADHAPGYHDHDERSVHLYLEESFTLLNSGSEAAIALVYPA